MLLLFRQNPHSVIHVMFLRIPELFFYIKFRFFKL